jgi:hypothetical protein
MYIVKKITFAFDELKEAEETIKNGFPDGIINYSKIYIVAKYLRDTLGYGAIRLERELIKFCKSQNPNFNPVTEAESIRKWVKSAIEYGLRNNVSVSISQKEIEFLKSIENPKNRKILFMTLVFSKGKKKGNTKRDKKDVFSSENYYIHYDDISSIIKMSKISNLTEVKFMRILNDYKEYLTFYNPERELIKLDFIDKNSENEFLMENLDEKCIEYYELIFGRNSPLCSICGNEFIRSSNRQKACPDCYPVLARERVSKFRRKSLSND